MKLTYLAASILSTALLIWSQSSLAQAPAAAHSLTVTGHAGTVPVIPVGGKSYVSVEDLARLTQGSLTFSGDQILLTLSGPPTDAPAPVPAAPRGFSRPFLQAAIEDMAIVREWRITIVNAIQGNYPIREDWVSEQRRKAAKNLALVSAAISTDDDRSAYPLLAGEFANVQKYSDAFLAARGAAQYIDPSSVDNDPLNQQILTCGRALQAMAAANKFQDEPACH